MRIAASSSGCCLSIDLRCLKKLKNTCVRWDDAKSALFYSCQSHYELETERGKCIDLTVDMPQSNWRQHVANQLEVYGLDDKQYESDERFSRVKYLVFKELDKVLDG